MAWLDAELTEKGNDGAGFGHFLVHKGGKHVEGEQNGDVQIHFLTAIAFRRHHKHEA